LGLAFLALLWLAPRFPSTPQGHGGIVGPSILADRAPGIEPAFCALGVGACGLLGWLGGMATRRGRPWPIAAALAALAVEAAFSVMARRHGWIPASGATLLLRIVLTRADLAAQLALFAVAAWWLGLPGPEEPEKATASATGKAALADAARRPETPARIVVALAGRLAPPLLAFAVLLEVVSPRPMEGVGLALALAMATIVQALLLPSRATPSLDDVSHWARPAQIVERVSWLLPTAIAPCGLWLLRWGKTLHWPLPSDSAVVVMVVGAAMAPIVAGAARCLCKVGPSFRPEAMLPRIFFWTLALAASCYNRYDGLVQGRLAYPIQALRRGLLPWRDVFDARGLGLDALVGWLAGPPTQATHSMGMVVLAILALATAWLALRALLKAWGWSWWPAALATIAVAVLAGGPEVAHLGWAWLALGIVGRFLCSRRLRWPALAGAVGFLAALDAVDVGALILLGIGGWCLAWGLALGGSRSSRVPRMGRLWPFFAFGLGASAVALPTALAAWRMGILDDALRLHFQYALTELHGDRLSFTIDNLASMIVPAAGLLGLWAGWGIVRRRQNGPLAGFVLALTFLCLLAFAGALGRSDVGRVGAGSAFAWPLLMTLAVWQCRRGHEPPPPPAKAKKSGAAATSAQARRRIARAAMLDVAAASPLRPFVAAAALVALAYASPPLVRPLGSAAASLPLPIHLDGNAFRRNARKPLMEPVADDASRAFFEVARQLGPIVGAPGPWSRQVVRSFYDFSNQPALYAWTGLTAPTRFFVTRDAVGQAWQEEVIEALRREDVRWVLWRGPALDRSRRAGASDGAFNATPGGAPSGGTSNGAFVDAPDWLTQWRVAEYVVRHYRPARALTTRGPALTIVGVAQPCFHENDGLLLERADARPIGMESQSLEPLWLEPVELGALPEAWGRGVAGGSGSSGGSGNSGVAGGLWHRVVLEVLDGLHVLGSSGAPDVPAPPPSRVFEAEAALAASGEGDLVVDRPLALAGAEELQLTFDPPVAGRCVLSWRNAAGQDAFRRIGFSLRADADAAGAYRLPVGSMPAWAWGGAPTFLSLSVQAADGAPLPIGARARLVALSGREDASR
jgi:hypothetical protein